MTFTEKLVRLTEDRIKTKLAKRAGMSSTGIHDMIAKGYTPNAGVAFRLSRILGVSLDWLLDDQQGWPPVWITPRVPEPAGAAA